jgi:hypothetical protein
MRSLRLSLSLTLRIATLVAALATVSCGHGSSSTSTPPEPPSDAPPPQKGTLLRWPEGVQYLLVDLSHDPATVELGLPRPSGLDALWSIASTENGGSGFFYSDAVHGAAETRVAYAADVRSVSEIRDASRYDFSSTTVGPVPVGAVVLVHHLPSDRYLALVLDVVQPTDARTAGVGPYAYANVTWYLTAKGEADFSTAF